MIPKDIHQIWIGPKPRPTAMMETWREKHPQWSYHVWTEETIDYPLENQAQYDVMKDFGGKADILRYEILNRHGGVYVDADMTCLRPLDPDFLENDFFAAFENEMYRPGLVANGFFGCGAGHPVMGRMIDRIGLLDLNRLAGADASVETGPYAFTEIIESFDGPVKVYPSHLFYPDHYLDAFCSSVENAFARHDWYFGYPTTCLTMVIESDTANLWRTLPRVKPHIGAFRIGIDSRRAPRSAAVIDAILGDVPGDTLEIGGESSDHAWAAALRAADGLADFLLMIEPDTALYDFRRSMLSLDFDRIEINEHVGAEKRPAMRLARSDGCLRFAGWPSPLGASGATSCERGHLLEGCHLRRFDRRPIGESRSMDESALLLEELERRPGEPETLFYLGQYFEDAGDASRAAYYYDLRAQAGGWEEQAWEACRRIAGCLRSTQAPWPVIEQALMRLYEMDPTRAEPLLELGVAAISRGDHAQAFEILSNAKGLPAPKNYFYWDRRTAQMVLEQLCVCGYYAGFFAEGLRAGLEALKAQSTVMSRDDIMRNIGFYVDKVEFRSVDGS